MKSLNYKIGVLKRKYALGRGDFEPGTLINLAKTGKSLAAKTEPVGPRLKLALKGDV